MNKQDNDKFFIRYLHENSSLKNIKDDNKESNNTKEAVKKLLDKEFEKKNELYFSKA